MSTIGTPPLLTLNDGHAHPQIGFGTYKVGFIPASASSAGGTATGQGGDAKATVQTALQLGYRFLDCAEFYGNEAAVGEAIVASGIARSELYLASKVWSDTLYAGRAAIRAQVERSLCELQTDYLDLYLVHWPVPGKHVLAYKHLEELQAEGKLRSIGVSNYTVEDYQELMAHAVVTPAVNQIEVNPFLYRKQTIDFFQKEGVAVQAYRSLRQGKEMEHPTIAAIAAAHAGKSPAQPSSAQVLGAWALQKGLIYIPKSEKPERMLENAAVLDWELSEAEVAQLDGLTSEHTIAEFHALYCKCVVRDTPLAALDPAGKNPAQGVKTDITAG